MFGANNVESFEVCCQRILRERSNRALNYAVGYAQAGIEECFDSPEAVQVQCLYILNNITGWRGPVAKETREELKRLSKAASWK